ncbi:MAG: tRNA uridine-5-carboxymethylaminomethyl(34) synthesis enzyme MnmG [Bacteroidales bacterium]
MNFRYDIIVVGGGHAGSEAAFIAATMGAKTLLVTMDMTKFAQMSCNPAMGGIAKGQIIREIDALGGMSAIITDRTMIQFRMLNRSKGPAMWSPRAQCDRMLFTREWRKVLESTDNLSIWQEQANALILEDEVVKGVRTTFGTEFMAEAVILTNGTFLNGLMHVGFNTMAGGRSGDADSKGISDQLREAGFSVERLKTGTSARVDGRSLNLGKMTEQKGDGDGRCFSYLHDSVSIRDERSCYITHTNEETHNVLREGLKYSPLFTGRIKGRGPRYCPSVEDKIVTFAGKEAHQLFLEPEGWDTNEYYINGFASSLKLETQLNALRKVEGLENVVIYRPGYAIEYDFFQPTQLKHTLETKKVGGLYFAGQINGTTGYEEAGAQGLMAGINAVLKIRGEKPFILKRDEAYIGVLIDDLVTKGVDEPYRMFTSRAEYRILLRQDNADERLTPKAAALGTAGTERMKRLEEKYGMVDEVITFIKNYSISPLDINPFLAGRETSGINQKIKAINIASRPQVHLDDLLGEIKESASLRYNSAPGKREIIEAAEIRIKYSGYLERERGVADKIKRLEDLKIPEDIDYEELASISTEGRQKLSALRPVTIGQASRISGVSSSDVSILIMYLGR